MASSAVIIYSLDKNSLLLAKRSSKHINNPNKWENVGGSLEQGETFEQAARREVFEETGINLGVLKEELVYTGSDGNTNVIIFSTVYDGEVKNTEPDFCDELRWVKIKELYKYDLASFTFSDFVSLGFIKEK